MKRLKTFISSVLITSILLFCFTVYADKTVTLYSQDGRKIENVPEDKIANYGSGWYTEDPNIKKVTLYSDDGRVIENVPENKVSIYGYGWYIRTYVTLYSDDGRTIENVPIDQVKVYGDGWYIREYTNLYSDDGRVIKNVPKDRIIDYGTGWYLTPPKPIVFTHIVAFPSSTSGLFNSYITEIKRNSIGTPELQLVAKNLSDKKISSFEFTCEFNDSFDRSVYRLGTENKVFNGIVQDAKLDIEDTSSIYPKNVGIYTFNLVLYDLATKVTNINLIRVKFADGSIWEVN